MTVGIVKNNDVTVPMYMREMLLSCARRQLVPRFWNQELLVLLSIRLFLVLRHQQNSSAVVSFKCHDRIQ